MIRPGNDSTIADRIWEITLKAMVPASVVFATWIVTTHFSLDKRLALIESHRAYERELLKQNFEDILTRLRRIEERLK